jgi:protein required for attachment to host cells
MLLAHGTIVAVIDGQHFALLRNDGDEETPELVAFSSPALDQHGHAAASHPRHTGGHDPAGQIVEDQHSTAVVAWLNHEVLEHRIHDLVIVAPPRTLGEMRPHYHGQLKQVLRRELSKELSGKTGAEVLAALRG